MSTEIEDFDFAKIRLFVDAPLSTGVKVDLETGQAHYLRNVMRQKVGDTFLAFNGIDGEWLGLIIEISKKQVIAEMSKKMREQDVVPDIELVFAPVKKSALDYLVQKSVELGVLILQPVVTEHTVVRRVNAERIRASAVEAAEQSGRLTLPTLRELEPLDDLLGAWPKGRALIFCDEARNALPLAQAAQALKGSPCSLLIGPEGGFSDAERTRIKSRPETVAVSLGPRIMRAETAAAAALAIWQSVAGDLSEQ